VFFVEWGNDARMENGTVEEAIHDGVRLGYEKGFLRKSMVRDPLRRVNTGDNTPPIIHITHTRGDRIRIRFLAKSPPDPGRSHRPGL
jgi:fumarate hydratase subunit alpha